MGLKRCINGTKMKTKIEKFLFKQISNLTDNKYLVWYDFDVAFQNTFQKQTQEFIEVIQEVVNELADRDYIIVDNFKIPKFGKGINFDEWEKKMAGKSTNSINIENLHSVNTQVGNNNTFSNGVSAEEFLAFIEKLEKSDDKPTLFSKIKEMVSTGVGLSKIVEFFGKNL